MSASRNITKLQTKYAIQHENMEMNSTKRRKLLYRRLTVFSLFAGFVAFLMITTYMTQLSALEDKVAQKKQLEKQLAGLEKKQQILKEDIVKLNDDEYIAKLARKEYFLSEKNEIIFNLPENDEEKSSD
ncbi:FtsB family cell division protein [Neobacillus sp. D3-1R]|uniref:FtsB family cell division protein n=1 Tax=Neobacillus sp. D3-1R TaxID=3445778 RepID=UPI003F9FE39B